MRPPAGPLLIVFVAVLTVYTGSSLVEAKRGCSAFGHSCFGGHGKRADLPSAISSSELPSLPQPSQEILLSPADDTRAAFPDQDVQSFELAPQRYLAWSKVQPFLRQWLESYRRSTEGMDTK